MSRCNVFDLDRRSLALSVEGSTQSYRKSLFTTILCSFFFFFFITSIILYSYRSSIWRLMHGYYNRIDWKQLRGYMHACALYIVLFSCSFSSTFNYLSHFQNRKHTHTSKQAFTNIVVSSQIKAKFTFSGLHNCKYIKCTWKPALTHMCFFLSCPNSVVIHSLFYNPLLVSECLISTMIWMQRHITIWKLASKMCFWDVNNFMK